MRALVALVAASVLLAGLRWVADPGAASAFPSGFVPVAFSGPSGRELFVLGTVPCRNGRCWTIEHTRDGGRTFARTNAPRLPGQGTAPILRFSTRRDGFAFVLDAHSPLFATHDAALTWRRLRLGHVLAFAATGRRAYAVTTQCSAGGCRRNAFWTSSAFGRAWTRRRAPVARVADVAAWGRYVWVLGSSTEGPTHDRLARSADGGRAFRTGRGPCVPELGGRISAASPTSVWAVCPTGTMAFAARSTDGGASFASLGTPPMSNSALLAPASPRVAVLARSGARPLLLRTADGGRTWRRATAPRQATAVLSIAFTDRRVGTMLVQTDSGPDAKVQWQELWRTTDAGASWSRLRLR